MSSHSNSLVLAKLCEHVNRRGKRYFVGRIGAVKLLMGETGNVDRGSPVWRTSAQEVGLAREIAADEGGR